MKRSPLLLPLLFSAVGTASQAPSPQAAAAPTVQSSPMAQAYSAEQRYALGGLRAFLGLSRVPIGVEVRPLDAPTPSAASLPPRVVRLPLGLPPPDLPPGSRPPIDDFLSRNPDYEAVADGPLFAVGPRGSTGDPENWLNARMPVFEIRDATAEEALTQLERAFDPTYDITRVVASEPVPPDTAVAMQRLSAIGRARQRRFSLQRSTPTVREVLNAIVLAHGEASWIVTFRGPTPSREASRIDIVFWRGASVSAHAAEPPPRPTLRRELIQLPLRRDLLVRGTMLAFMNAPIPLGMELGPECRPTEPPGDRLALDVTGLDAGELVSALVSQCGGYEYKVVGGVLNVGPVGTFDKSDYLTVRKKAFRVSNVPLCDTLTEVHRLVNPQFASPPPSARLMRAPAGAGGPVPGHNELLNPVSVELKNATVRDVLNALVTAHGRALWIVERLPEGLKLSYQAGPNTVFITTGPHR